MSSTLKLPYWRLSGFYFFYFAALGCFLPYWALYLQSLGLSHTQIGQLMAILPAAKVISPNLWGWLADHTDRNVPLIRLSSGLTVASFALVFWGEGFAWLALVSLLLGFFWNAPLPLFEAVTLSYLRQDSHRYSRIRIWGSIGFITAVFGAGWALNTVLIIDCLPTLLFGLFLSMGLVALLLPGRSVRTQGAVAGPLGAIFRRPGVIAFFFACLLIQFAHGPYYTFFSVYLKEHDYDASQTGLLWSLGILAEILLFWFFQGFFKRFSLRRVLLVAIALSVLRWLLIGWWVDYFAALAIAQMLHAASFGATHVAAIQFIHRHFAWPHQGKGQALYGSLSFGLGGMLGSYASGEVWVSLGPEFVFSVAAGLSFVALLVVWIWVERPGADPH
ncbi:MAG: MFS transporter [Methylococcaceae bacterium]|nr:MFS transporter [Methylococcaceae bacterium]